MVIRVGACGLNILILIHALHGIPGRCERGSLTPEEKTVLQPLLVHTFPLHSLARAQEVFMQKKHVGNIVVTPGTVVQPETVNIKE